jgi:hypothetical protein
LVAVAHSILVSVYYLLTRQQDYVDLGNSYFDTRDAQEVQQRLVRRLEGLGLTVTIAPALHTASL